jgi:hypothetical protein
VGVHKLGGNSKGKEENTNRCYCPDEYLLCDHASTKTGTQNVSNKSSEYEVAPLSHESHCQNLNEDLRKHYTKKRVKESTRSHQISCFGVILYMIIIRPP